MFTLALTACQKQSEKKSTEAPTEVETETIESESETRLDIENHDDNSIIIPQAVGVNDSENEIAQRESEEQQLLLEKVSKAEYEHRETEAISTETISLEEMQELENNIDEYVKQETIKTMRLTAKTEVARYKSEGNEAFQDITDEMIDNYSEEELNNLMVEIYRHLKY